jgi:hypothetical protein
MVHGGRYSSASVALFISVAMLGAMPIPAAPTQINAPDAEANDWFGLSIAREGDTLFIGAVQDDDGGVDAGSVYLYKRDLIGQWNQVAKLAASDAAGGKNFGYNLSLRGTTLLVGTQEENSGRQGTVYFFTDGGGDTWTQGPVITPSDGTANDGFGAAVTLGDGRAIVGAYLAENPGAANSGCAYVFEKDINESWVQAARLIPETLQADSGFGARLCMSGDLAMVSAILEDTPASNGGATYLFQRSIGGTWTQRQRFAPAVSAAGDSFGDSLAIHNGALLIGAPGDNSGAGAVYVFREVAGVYQQVQKVLANDASVGAGFGASVSPSGSSLLIGARFADISPFADAGAVYLFNLNTGGNWQQAAKISNPEPFTNDQFGRYAVLDGSTAFIGTFLDDEPAAGAGSVYVYTDLPVGQEAALAVTSVVQNEAGVVQINFNLTPHDPPPANGYAIRVLAYPTSQDCDTTSGIPDLDFDDISTIVSGDTTMSSTGGQGTILWDIRAMDNGPIRQKYYVANGSALFRVFADPVN